MAPRVSRIICCKERRGQRPKPKPLTYFFGTKRLSGDKKVVETSDKNFASQETLNRIQLHWRRILEPEPGQSPLGQITVTRKSFRAFGLIESANGAELQISVASPCTFFRLAVVTHQSALQNSHWSKGCGFALPIAVASRPRSQVKPPRCRHQGTGSTL